MDHEDEFGDRTSGAGVKNRDEDIAALRSKRVSAEASLAAATKGYKKMRQMRGADAHKRVWYFRGAEAEVVGCDRARRS
jgi:hypothetical protein